LIVLQTFAPVVLCLGGWCAARADDGSPAPPKSHPEVRAAVRSDFQFLPPEKRDAAPAWSTHASASDLPPASADDPGVVKMAPVIVKGDRVFRAMNEAMKKQAAAAEVRKEYSRLGIGVHVHKLGPAALYMITVFDIPVQVGISW